VSPNSVYDTGYYTSHYTQILNSERYYRLLALFWRNTIFLRHGLPLDAAVLDYGCGLGQVSAGLPRVTCFDPSEYAQRFLQRRGRSVVARPEQIPSQSFDLLLSSHSLEHSINPRDDLIAFHKYVKPEGKIVLVLPVEANQKPALARDCNLHCYSWTFQTITNLLLCCNWKPIYQSHIYGPFGLNTLGFILPAEMAIVFARSLGKLMRKFKSFLTIAQVLTT
jgi:SAM-dependent methyltransferase